MPTQTITRTPLSDHIGLELAGIDLDQPLSESDEAGAPGRVDRVRAGASPRRAALGRGAHAAERGLRRDGAVRHVVPQLGGEPVPDGAAPAAGQPQGTSLRDRRRDEGGVHRLALGPVLHADHRARSGAADGRACGRRWADRVHRRDRGVRPAERGDQGPDRGPRGRLRVQPRDGGEPRVPARRRVPERAERAAQLPARGPPAGDHPARDRSQGAEAVADALQDRARHGPGRGRRPHRRARRRPDRGHLRLLPPVGHRRRDHLGQLAGHPLRHRRPGGGLPPRHPNDDLRRLQRRSLPRSDAGQEQPAPSGSTTRSQ